MSIVPLYLNLIDVRISDTKVYQSFAFKRIKIKCKLQKLSFQIFADSKSSPYVAERNCRFKNKIEGNRVEKVCHYVSKEVNLM